MQDVYFNIPDSLWGDFVFVDGKLLGVPALCVKYVHSGKNTFPLLKTDWNVKSPEHASHINIGYAKKLFLWLSEIMALNCSNIYCPYFLVCNIRFLSIKFSINFQIKHKIHLLHMPTCLRNLLSVFIWFNHVC